MDTTNLSDSSALMPATVAAFTPANQDDCAVGVPPVAEDAGGLDVEQLKSEAKSLWARGRQYRLALGGILFQLHQALAKPGRGSYARVVRDELGIPYNTARDYIREYRETSENSRYEIRNVEPTDPVVPYDPNDGTPDSVDIAIGESRDKVGEAEKRQADPSLARDFSWKFHKLSGEEHAALLSSKKALGQPFAVALLVEAARLNLSVENFAKLLLLLKAQIVTEEPGAAQPSTEQVSPTEAATEEEVL